MLLTKQVVLGNQSSKPKKREVKVFTRSEAQSANARMRSPHRDLSPARRKSRSRSKLREPTRKEARPTSLVQQIAVVKQKRQKAMQRQRKYEQKLRACRGERGLLETHSIKEPQRQDYARRLSEFYNFVARFELDISSEKKLDEALVDYSDLMYLNGESQDAGSRLKAALEYHRPEAAREGMLNLPRFRRSLKGWRKMAPNQTRLPMVEYIKSSISGIMLCQGWKEMALFNELSFSTYARPGELLKMRVCDVVPKKNAGDHPLVILAPFERGESSKTGIYDEVLILEDTRASFLGPIVCSLAKQKELQEGPEVSMWGFNARKYLQIWRACVGALDVASLATSPYQNRHGGASRDHLMRLRSVQEIQRRGRWACDTSARIYDKPGRLQQVLNKMQGDLQPFGEYVRRNFADLYLGGKVQTPPRLTKRMRQFFKA